MADGDRIEPGPAVRRGAPINIRFDGRRIAAYEGETVAAALHAGGVRALMRSIKYHRPRGLFCATGACAGCLVRVDGKPNERACLTPARDGMVVKSQNAMPTARRDMLGIVDKVYRRKFEYHEKFLFPRFLVPLYHAVIRRMAGFGKIPDAQPLPPRRPPIEQRAVDVVVVGAGPAGLAAAVAAAEGAADVLLVDEGDRAGGSLLLHTDVNGQHGAAVAEALTARLLDAGGTHLPSSVAFGLYMTDGHGEALRAPGLLAVRTPERVIEVRARSLVVATGYHETPAVFAGNDLPGVMGARAALILLHRHGVLAGHRVLAASSDPLAQRALADLGAAGANVVGTLGEGALADTRIVRAEGGVCVEGVVLESLGRTWRESVDLIVCAGDETPRVELLQQAGALLGWDGNVHTATMKGAATSVSGVFAVGEVLGALDARGGPAAAMRAGSAAGEAAAKHARGGGA